MENALIIYDSGYGATKFAAQVIENTLSEQGINVDISPIGQIDLSSYDTIFIGSPIRLGKCTSKIKRYLTEHFETLKYKKIAIFFTCMSVTSDTSEQGVRLFVDHKFNTPNKPKARLRIMENNHTVSFYLKHFLKLIPGISPTGIAFFKGRLHTEKLGLLHRIIMRFAMFSLPEIENGDFLEPNVIESWVQTQMNSQNIAQQMKD
jgi:menaquinone-dependent protoporphyrinogen IX oxidase